GLWERGRVGRSVLYSRSAAGEVLVRARQEPETAPASRAVAPRS
ncbi:transcriptional regulator, partial [Streptomyces sp. ID05-39B]|nr:transcriptional regulator [Streptomyces sp. ID05-39B]